MSDSVEYLFAPTIALADRAARKQGWHPHGRTGWIKPDGNEVHFICFEIGLLVFVVTLTLPLSGVSYAADKITLTCSGMQWDGSFPIKKETVPPQPVVIDPDKGIVTMPLGDSDLSEITESYVTFAGVSDDRKRSWRGRIDRISGAGYVTITFGSEVSSNIQLSCKPAKPLF